MYWNISPPGIKRFAEAGVLHPKGERCKNPCWGKSRGPREAFFPFFFIEQECIEFIYCQYYPATRGVISNKLPLWKKNGNALPQVKMNSKIPPPPPPPPSAICTSRLPQGAFFPIHPSTQQRIITIHPDSRQCIDILFFQRGRYRKYTPNG